MAKELNVYTCMDEEIVRAVQWRGDNLEDVLALLHNETGQVETCVVLENGDLEIRASYLSDGCDGWTHMKAVLSEGAYVYRSIYLLTRHLGFASRNEMAKLYKLEVGEESGSLSEGSTGNCIVEMLPSGYGYEEDGMMKFVNILPDGSTELNFERPIKPDEVMAGSIEIS